MQVGSDNYLELDHKKNRIVGGINASINSLPYQVSIK
jgi:hypothetical protein